MTTEGETPTGLQDKERESQRIPVLVSGLPGKMATLVAERIAGRNDLNLLGYALSSLRHVGGFRAFSEHSTTLIAPEMLEEFSDVLQPTGVIAVDFTTPDSVKTNADLYSKLRIPFVMGTSLGPHAEEVRSLVVNSQISAVIAPNMDMGVVGKQMDLDEFTQNHPGIFQGAAVEIVESHQASKVDKEGKPVTSATAKAFQQQLEIYGARLQEEITSIRDPQRQLELGVPEEFLGGHGYHWVTVYGTDGKIIYQFETRVNGRGSYVDGTIAAIKFLVRKMASGSRGEIFGMRDVIADVRSTA